MVNGRMNIEEIYKLIKLLFTASLPPYFRIVSKQLNLMSPINIETMLFLSLFLFYVSTQIYCPLTQSFTEAVSLWFLYIIVPTKSCNESEPDQSRC